MLGKVKYFGLKFVLNERVVDPDVLFIQTLLENLSFQWWPHLCLDASVDVYEEEVVDFYTNLVMLEVRLLAPL